MFVLLVSCGTIASADPQSAADPGAITTTMAAAATANVPPATRPPSPEDHDVLVFADGDRTQGELLRREEDIIVFRSLRFGELRVPAANARVIRAAPDESVAAAVPVMPDVVIPVDAESGDPAKGETPAPPLPLFSWSRWTSPAALAASLRNVFGQWHGRFSLSSSSRTDTQDRSTVVLESKVGRKWATDEISIEARYDSAKTNDTVTADTVRGNGSWRHDLAQRYFITYRPTLEWNRNYRSPAGQTLDYVLLQQELGVGVNLIAKKGRTVRIGVAENLFDVWVSGTPSTHETSSAESVFAELELELPWRITLSDRGIYYFSLANHTQGWENRFEVNKKLTETLSLGLRHEYRRNSPDSRLSDYALWRFLLGFDF